MPTNEQKEAARILAAMNAKERSALLAETDNHHRHAVESAKVHPIAASRFTTEEKAVLRAHLLDGGGVKDDAYLRAIVMQAIMDDDWHTVFRELPHVLKNWINLRDGVVVEMPEGGSTVIGYGPSVRP